MEHNITHILIKIWYLFGDFNLITCLNTNGKNRIKYATNTCTKYHASNTAIWLYELPSGDSKSTPRDSIPVGTATLPYSLHVTYSGVQSDQHLIRQQNVETTKIKFLKARNILITLLLPGNLI